VTISYSLPKEVCHRMKPRAYSFKFQYLSFSSRSFSSCLHFLSCLPTPLSFLQKCVLEVSSYPRCDQMSLPSFILLYIGYSFPLWLCAILLPLSQGHSNCSPFFSSTTFQKFQDISDLFSKCSTLLVSSVNVSLICW